MDGVPGGAHVPAAARDSLPIAATVFLLLSLAVMWVVAACVWPRLPEQLPVHFGIDGTPDRFAPKAESSWFELPLVATALAAGVWVLERITLHLALRRPHWLNVPRKEVFLALGPDARVRVVRPMAVSLRGALAPVSWVFTFIMLVVYVTATGGSVGGGAFVAATIACVVVSLAWIGVGVFALRRNLRRETAGG
jgi:uncharacterized membrane protein